MSKFLGSYHIKQFLYLITHQIRLNPEEVCCNAELLCGMVKMTGCLKLIQKICDIFHFLTFRYCRQSRLDVAHMLNNHGDPIKKYRYLIAAALAKKFTLLYKVHTTATYIKQEFLQASVLLHLGCL